jgi:HEAT repeat protein
MMPNNPLPQPPTNDDELHELLALLREGEIAQRQQAAIALWNVQDTRLIAPFMEALNDPDSTVRANVVGGLGTNRAHQATDALIAILQNDDNEIVRERAVTALAQIGDERVLEPLMDAVDDASAFVRNRAIYVLGASGASQVVDVLIEALDHKQASTQGVAAWALGAIGDTRAYDPLLGLLSAKKADVRGNAAWALGELGDERAIDALLPMVRDKDPQVRGKVAWALGAIGEAVGDVRMVKPLIDLLDDFTEVKGQAAHVFVSQYAAEALMQIGSDVAKLAVHSWRPRAEANLVPFQVREMFQHLISDEREQRQAAMEYIAGLDMPAVPHIVKGLKHRHARVRQGCAQALGMLAEGVAQDEEAVNALIHALQDQDSGVWSQSTAALSKMGQHIEATLRAQQKHPNRRVQLGVNLALWRSIRADDALPVVLQAVQDEDELVRSSAVTSLWLQSDVRALATLQIQLSKEDGVLAQYIVQALHAIGTEGAHATIRHWTAQQAKDGDDTESGE